jgi:thioredoxin reductase (NADPH)
VQNLPHFTGEQRLVYALLQKENVTTIMGTVVTGYVTENGQLTGLNLKSDDGTEQTIQVDGAFLAVGLQPENKPFEHLVDLNAWGYFDVDEHCATKTPGLFVAGDCRSKYIRQVVTAAGDGAIAAMGACRFLD